MISPAARRIVLFAALAASLAAAWLVRDEGDSAESLVAAADRGGGRKEKQAAPQSPQPTLLLDLGRLARRAPADTDADPFRSKSWYVAPPPPPPAPPPKPTAPPLPFQYVGKFDAADGGNLVVYLAKGNESFAVKPGDKFANDYRFEGIEHGQIVVMYLPMSLKQRLPMGAS